jgi:aquaporin NIP
MKLKKYIGEFIGTFALVLAGTGAIVINNYTNGVITHPGIALTFGLIVMAMIYAVGDISGAHLNPAVSIGFWLAARLPKGQVPGYILSQILGALTASLTLRFMFPLDETLGATLPTIPVFSAFVFEIILTFFLMFVIIHVSVGAKEKGLMAGVAVGATVGLEAMFAGPVTGASMNPARSLAPALVSGHLEHLWLYLVAPVIGASLAILLCRVMREDGCCRPEGAPQDGYECNNP